MRYRGRSVLWGCLLLLVVACHSSSAEREEDMTNEELRRRQLHEQHKRFFEAKIKCQIMIDNMERPTDGVYCNATFDNIMCWPYVRAGHVAVKPCPDHVFNLNPDEQATRICQEDGTWGPPPPDVVRSNSSTVLGWTNYTACEKRRVVPDVIRDHMPVISLISRVGYSISLVSLIIATAIMLKIKRLHCQRNVIHINLFVTFMIRALICLLRDSLLVEGLGLPKDVQYNHVGDIIFNDGPHWECKLLFTLFYWSLCSNYMWIFVEGLYLHTLIFFAVFDQKAIFKWYIIIGWVAPFLFVIPWVLVRIFYHNTLCWNTHENSFFWILQCPIVVSICMNFFFFLNIIRVLYTKLRASATHDSHRYRKLAKSTLVLIPLFGVYYIFFIVVTNHDNRDPGLEVGVFYAEMTLNSFQGMVIAILFCFTNGEVRSEIIKHWQRHMLRRQSVASLRSSRAMSTTSFFLKERTSISGPTRRGSKFPNVESCLSIKSMENGDVPCRFPKPKSSPCLRGADTNGSDAGRDLKGPNLSPGRPRVDSDSRRHRPPLLSVNSRDEGVGLKPLVKLGADDAMGSGDSSRGWNGAGNPREGGRKGKSGKIPQERAWTNGVGVEKGTASLKEAVEEEEDSANTMEFSPMLT